MNKNPTKLYLSLFLSLLLGACSHPIEIVGEGDVTSDGGRSCTLADFLAELDNCTENLVSGAYNETYTATPHPLWFFNRWENCIAPSGNECTFDIDAATVGDFQGDTAPPLRAVFTKYQLTGPILPSFAISLGMGAPVPADVGYVKEEYFIEGNATSYTPVLPLPTDGKLEVTANPPTPDGNYKTRMVVMRPLDPADFNGTVIVEWLNVSAGVDTPPDYIMAHNEFIRSGYTWIGVSAQAVGVNALNGRSRYASLEHPGDSFSYSMYSHMGMAIKQPGSPLLGGLVPERLIAVGESQSAGRMVTYIDAVHPMDEIYDGFMVHSRFGSGAPISQSPLPLYRFSAPAPIRDDLDVPVFVVLAEGDVIDARLESRQPDTPLIRLWELAGTAHADAYTIAGLSDNGDGTVANLMFNYMRQPTNPLGCDNPINAGGHHWTLQAAFDALNTWVTTVQDPNLPDTAPPIGPRLEVEKTSPVELARDMHGNALGGVRSPQIDAPIARLDALNGGFSFCRLFGRTVPFTAGKVFGLYPTREDFLTAWSDAIANAVEGGFLLEADVAELEASAETWSYPY